ncbi:MAG: biotin/lipoyl-binding protein [Colwellia sp.]|nr:biotin/lipoyl-binding protein [Colwellia sp.]
MDTKITPPKYQKKFKLVAALLLVVTVSAFSFMKNGQSQSGQSQNVEFESITSSMVFTGNFEDSISLRGSISPQTSIYLDAMNGGRVEEKLVEQGQYVEKGQPLVRLSNISLQLDVMSREAQVTEQLNFLRNTQMTMTTNRLNLRRDALEIDREIAHLNRKITQAAPLVKNGVLAKEKLQSMTLDLSYYQERKVLTQERQKQEEKIRQVQVKQLEDSATMLKENLLFARSNLDNLLVKAPVSGYLSELNIELGESKSIGTRLGQIDLTDGFKLVANIDEYYLNIIALGMKGEIEHNGEIISLSIAKIDSRVRDAQFQIELKLPSHLNNIKRGQSFELALTLNQGIKNSLLLKRGAFTRNSGGNWAFVLNPDGNSATRRDIKLGKKNQDYYQVLSGLNADEQVVTSNYNAFDKAQTLYFTGQNND